MKLRIALVLCLLSVICSAQVTPIKHVVIIVKENRTFDHMFGTYPRANGTTTGKVSHGTTIPLNHATDQVPNIVHSYGAAVRGIDGGRMDKFDLNAGCARSGLRVLQPVHQGRHPALLGIRSELRTGRQLLLFADWS